MNPAPRFPHLFQPLRLGALELKNRVTFTSLGIDSYDARGTVTEQNISFVKARSRETGLILTTVATATYKFGQLKFIGAYDDSFIPSLKRFARAGHSGGARIFLQLFAMGGPNTLADHVFRDVIPYVPSTGVPLYKEWKGKNTPVELEGSQIKELVEEFVQASRRAQEAGFDGVELFAAEDFLLSSFLTPYFNRRTDEYGGNLENMVRFPVEIIRGIKRTCGQDFPVGFKYNAYYEFPEGGGVDLDLGVAIGLRLAREKVAYLQAYAYAKHTLPFSLFKYTIMPGMYQPRNTTISVAEALKRNIPEVPIMAVGGIVKPDEADRIIAEGQADLVSIGRAFVADPLWAFKARRGLRIRPCIRCYVCLHEATNGRIIGCAVNPDVLAEKAKALVPAAAPRRVMVIGAGPGGITAALTAARRGHRVSIFEQGDAIGGALVPASMPGVKHEFVDLLEYYRAELLESQVEQVTGKRVTPDLVREWAPDSLIVAIGAKPVPPELPGIEGPQAIEAARAVLQSSRYRGARIGVIGGSTIGCEVALLLRRLGNSVTVLERSARLMEENPIEYNTLVLERLLREEGVEVRTATRVLEIRPAALLLSGFSELPVDVAVYVPEYRPRQEETDRLLESCRDARALGDCVKPAGIFQAVTEGFAVGRTI